MKRGKDVLTIFKILSNQTRLDILMLLRDSCLTASEVAEKLKIDLSTAYRYLNQMVKNGILSVIKAPNGDRFDFSSVHVLKILEEAVGLIYDMDGRENLKANSFVVQQIDKLSEPKRFVDMRGQICPVPEIMTRKELAKLKPGETLVVICDYPLSKERITSFASREGYTVEVEEIGPISKIYIQRSTHDVDI